MGNKPRPVTIKSFKDTHGKIDFEMLEGSQKTDTLVFNKTKDNMKKDESYDIQFTLVNTDGLQLEFKQDTQDVMWVAKGDKTAPPGCPKNKISDPEFTVTGVTATTLDVTNTDKDECKFKFVLNFIDTGESQQGRAVRSDLRQPERRLLAGAHFKLRHNRRAGGRRGIVGRHVSQWIVSADCADKYEGQSVGRAKRDRVPAAGSVHAVRRDYRPPP